MVTSNLPSTYIVRYAAGIDCRRVDEGVMGERKESVISRGSENGDFDGAGIEYVRFVVDASYFAPLYVGNATV
jgi:hypothetical protein